MNSTIEKKLAALAATPNTFRTLNVANQIDVPTSKVELLKWLNENCV